MPISIYHDITEKQYPFPKGPTYIKIARLYGKKAPSTCLCQSRGDLNDLFVL